MNCKQCRESMVGQAYEETDENTRKEFHTHLDSCPQCSAAYESMRTTLDLMSLRKQTAVDDSLFTTQWERIEQRIATNDVAQYSGPTGKKIVIFPVRIPAWVYGAAAILLIAAGIYIGKTIWSVPVEVVQPQSATALNLPPAVADSVVVRVLAYLGTSKNLLLGVMNTDEADYSTATLVHQQRISRQLLQQANYIRTTLTKPDQQQIKQLVGDLEVILLQLANIEVKPGVPAIELVKTGVDKKSIILKINVEEIRAMSQSPETEKSKNHNL
jgi:hypothetical protein